MENKNNNYYKINSVFNSIAKLEGNKGVVEFCDILNLRHDEKKQKELGIEKITQDESVGFATIVGKVFGVIKLIFAKPTIYDNIKSEWKPYIKNVAKHTGYSESCIKSLVAFESFDSRVTNKGDGRLTGGFGHTDNAGSNRNIKSGQNVSAKQAFAWLEQDIKDKTNSIKTIVENYDSLPVSFKEALLDIAFNRGEGAFDRNNVENGGKALMDILESGNKKNYPKIAIKMVQRFKNEKNNFGLMKRNVYRFLMAIHSLTPRDRLTAMNDKEIRGYYNRTCKYLNDNGYTSDASMLKRAWEKALKNATKKLK